MQIFVAENHFCNAFLESQSPKSTKKRLFLATKRIFFRPNSCIIEKKAVTLHPNLGIIS